MSDIFDEDLVPTGLGGQHYVMFDTLSTLSIGSTKIKSV